MVTLYRDRGQVDLIITDPPYNTGNDFRYNDNWDKDPNDPGLGDLVAADDAARHTKWMKFMYPRLQMMQSDAQARRRARDLHRPPRAVPPRPDARRAVRRAEPARHHQLAEDPTRPADDKGTSPLRPSTCSSTPRTRAAHEDAAAARRDDRRTPATATATMTRGVEAGRSSAAGRSRPTQGMVYAHPEPVHRRAPLPAGRRAGARTRRDEGWLEEWGVRVRGA